MLQALKKQLLQWKENAKIKAVLITSSSEKAFCAGGDIKSMYAHKDEPIEQKKLFFELEYSINALIYHYPKPYIALLNGIVMGGGAGISIHGSHRVGTPNIQFAMPETKIGFFPDVGMSYYFSRFPNEIGTYLGLTGYTIDTTDMMQLGLLTHCVSSDTITLLEKQLIDTPFTDQDTQRVTDIISSFALPISTGKFSAGPNELHCFQGNSIKQIIDALKQNASNVASDLLKRSPHSLKITLEHLREAKTRSFDQVIQKDLSLAYTFLKHPDFYEGIRAVLIDKDQPQWALSEG
jgi:enoyl-CoA hydratase/carnithine racemase